MRFDPLSVDGAYRIDLAPSGDHRGYFMRAYDEAAFAERGLVTHWPQLNESFSGAKGTIRGFHFQRPPHTETKLVRVARGAVLDVVVDLRRSSPSFGQWASVELSEDNHHAIYVPRGCGHAFCTLTEDALVLYQVDATYAPGAEGGLRFDDPHLDVPWPVDVPVVSEKDRVLPTWDELDFFFE